MEDNLKHTEEHFTSSAILRDIVIGMADGLTVLFALAAKLSGGHSLFGDCYYRRYR